MNSPWPQPLFQLRSVAAWRYQLERIEAATPDLQGSRGQPSAFIC